MKNKKFIFNSLCLTLFFIATIIVVGGITRLTGSGLSMVDWSPVFGIFPPIFESQWDILFNDYQKFPEFKIKHPNMNLNEFKFIFFWEYLHRILGRIVGLSVLIPLVYLTLKKQLTKKSLLIFSSLSLLVILQGFIGWFMVKSGLVDIPYVSHFRLALHLSLAFFIVQVVVWNIANFFVLEIRNVPKIFHVVSFNCLILLCLQIVYGAFTSGLKAGYYFNTYPKMGETWLPEIALNLEPIFLNLINNPIMIQFIHRHVAIAVVMSFAILFFLSERYSLDKVPKKFIRWSVIIVLCQFVLGVTTLVFYVPLWSALLHQFLGIILLSLIVLSNHSIRYKYVKLSNFNLE